MNIITKRKVKNAIVGISLAALGCCSAVCGYFLFDLSNQNKAQQETYIEENEALKKDKDALQTKINKLESDKVELREQQIILEEEKAVLQNNLARVTLEKTQLQQQYETTLGQEREEYAAQIAQLEDEQDALETEIATLEQREAGLKADKQALQEELDKLEKEMEELKSQTAAVATSPVDASRLVLMLGDSMSAMHIKEAETRTEDSLYVSSFAYSGVAQLSDGENAEDTYKQLAANAKAKGLGLAFVTTDILYQDSSYNFTASSATAGDVSAIITAQCASDFDLIFGADYYDEAATAYTYAANKTQLQDAGYTFIDNLNYDTITAGKSAYALGGDKLFGAFQTVSTSEYTAMQDNSKKNLKPCLGQMTDIAIKFMEQKFPDGYVLIVENNQIGENTQEFVENGDSAAMVECLVEFDRTARIIRNAYQNNDIDYSLVVTADSYSTNEVPFFIDAVGCDLTGKTTTSDILSFMTDNLQAESEVIEKVVMMIGDGMGVNHIGMAKNFLDDGEKLNMTEFEYSGQLDTNSLSTIAGGGTPDSAAGGSALATGKRVINGYISMDSEGNNIENLSEYYKARGMGVGVISTDYLFEATPAAFSAHTNSRYNYVDIRSQQYGGDIDLFLGGDMYSETLLADENGFYAVDSTNGTTSGYVYALEQQKIKDAGYTFITDMGAGKVDMNANKLFGAFPSISVSTNKAPLDSSETNTAPSLTQMTKLAIEWMELHYGDKGYFLMIEENNIDVLSEQHSDGGKVLSYDTGDVVESIFELDRAAGKVKEMFDATGDNYFIAISADHATGSLTKSSSRENYGFWSAWHDTQNIPYFIEIKGPKSVDFDWFAQERRTVVLEDNQISVEYDDCNLFARLFENEGDTTTLTNHAKENILNFGKFQDAYNAYKSFIANYTIDENPQQLSVFSNDANFKSYLEFFNSVESVFSTSNNPIANGAACDFTAGAIYGINKPFAMNFGTTASTNHDDLISVLSKLFGFSDVDVFKQYVEQVRNLAINDRGKVDNNGAVAYEVSSNVYAHMMPYAVETELAGTIFVFIIIDTAGEMSVWISDVEAAYNATNFAGATLEANAKITISGRCTLFSAPENTKVVDLLKSLEVVNPKEQEG